ncbi:MAG TPA: DUF2155 domain-containing protein [Xanthobacteraceae bacterium]
MAKARIAALVIVITALFAAAPLRAQFGNTFGGPPRPPADIPNAPYGAPPPPADAPDAAGAPQPPPQYAEPYPAQPIPAGRSPYSIESQPLPPPPAAAAVPPSAPMEGDLQRLPPPVEGARTPPPVANPVRAQPANQPPHPAETAPQEDDTVVTETPTQHIENGRAVFAGLDKITGRTISFDAAIGETVQFGALQVTARACYTRPPTEPTNTDAFVEVDEVTLQGETKRIFTGWMFASSPGLHAVEHPVYDVWLTDCASPPRGSVAQSTSPTPAAAARSAGPRGRQSAPRQALPPPPAPITDD